MEYSSQEIQLLTQVLPNIAAQFRTALGNMQAALKTGDDPDSCILRQSYYRLLRIVTNLTDAYMLTEEEPLPKQDTELVEFFDALCRQAQVPLELCGLTLRHWLLAAFALLFGICHVRVTLIHGGNL